MSLVPELTTAEAAKLIDVRPDYLRKMRVRGTGPRYIKAGGRVRYDREDVVEWVGHKLVSLRSPAFAAEDYGTLDQPIGPAEDWGTL